VHTNYYNRHVLAVIFATNKTLLSARERRIQTDKLW